MSSSCKNIRRELIDCIKDSKCINEKGFTFHECLKNENSILDDECKQLKTLYFECRRGQVIYMNLL